MDASLRVAADQLWGAAEYALLVGQDDDHEQLHSIACAVFSVINTIEPETQRIELLELLKRYRLVAEQPTKPQAIAA
ncbi:hypothetical protein [Thiocapsa rosea]|uniref:hypothetical protein n=1 Tax=Thiocapsa rosea TaxID=69360 RepID=UPI000EB3855D|nr:hypothetical protein [Thiocapsa rosea]